MPSVVDFTKAQQLTLKDGKASVVMHSKQEEEIYFKSTLISEAKELDFVLVWDQKQQSYLLHKLHSTITLQPSDNRSSTT